VLGAPPPPAAAPPLAGEPPLTVAPPLALEPPLPDAPPASDPPADAGAPAAGLPPSVEEEPPVLVMPPPPVGASGEPATPPFAGAPPEPELVVPPDSLLGPVWSVEQPANPATVAATMTAARPRGASTAVRKDEARSAVSAEAVERNLLMTESRLLQGEWLGDGLFSPSTCNRPSRRSNPLATEPIKREAARSVGPAHVVNPQCDVARILGTGGTGIPPLRARATLGACSSASTSS
jgi:hypothetical protein